MAIKYSYIWIEMKRKENHKDRLIKWVKQHYVNYVYHPPVISIFIGAMVTIPSHRW